MKIPAIIPPHTLPLSSFVFNWDTFFSFLWLLRANRLPHSSNYLSQNRLQTQVKAQNLQELVVTV